MALDWDETLTRLQWYWDAGGTHLNLEPVAPDDQIKLLEALAAELGLPS